MELKIGVLDSTVDSLNATNPLTDN